MQHFESEEGRWAWEEEEQEPKRMKGQEAGH